MAKKHGQGGAMTFAGDLVGHLQGWNLDIQAAVLEGYSMGDGWADNETGVKRWTGSCEVYFDPADAGQISAAVGEVVAIQLYPGGDSAGEEYYSGSAIITGVPLSGTKDGWVSKTINFAGKGPLATATVT